MILDLYEELNRKRVDSTGYGRFINEIFVDEVYKEAKPKLTIVDLGAYEGEFGFYCLPFASKIYAVEPDPRPFQVMKTMISQYGLDDTIRIFPVAISSKNRSGLLHASGFGGSSVTNINDDKTVEIQLKTLNTFLKENNIEKVDVLKMDVESSEKDILLAADIDEALQKVTLSVGEDHGYGDLIKEVFERNGFKVDLSSHLFVAIKI